MSDSEVVVKDLAFGEGPRWRDGRLWFSDMHDHAVKAYTPESGALETIVAVPGAPSGLGWDATVGCSSSRWTTAACCGSPTAN